jgi:hypothetical protein
MSRGVVAGPAHSVGSRAQKSAHPGGGCVTSAARTARRSDPARAGSASIALVARAAITTVPNFVLKFLEITVMIRRDPKAAPSARCARHCALGFARDALKDPTLEDAASRRAALGYR